MDLTTLGVFFVLAVVGGLTFYLYKQKTSCVDGDVTSSIDTFKKYSYEEIATCLLGETIGFSDTNDCGIRFYAKEGWSAPESTHCWTGGKQSRILLKLESPPQWPLILTMLASPFVSPGERYQEVTASVNGHEIAVWKMNALLKYQAMIPKNIVADGVLDIRFNIAKPIAPCEVSDSKDFRRLGFAVKELVIA